MHRSMQFMRDELYILYTQRSSAYIWAYNAALKLYLHLVAWHRRKIFAEIVNTGKAVCDDETPSHQLTPTTS